jgi:hypothetical protein
MELSRGYHWIREREGSWKIGLAEYEGEEKFLTLFGEPGKKRLSDIPEGSFQFVRIFCPGTSQELRKKKEEEKYGKRKPMQEIRPLYFVVQPEQHERQIRYVAQDELSTAAQEGVRISKSERDKDFYVMEAKPIGKIRNGKMNPT